MKSETDIRRRYFSIFLFFFFLFIIQKNGTSQSINGVVKNSSTKVISGATVILKQKTEGLVYSYTTTNSYGTFKIVLEEKILFSDYVLVISAVGYETDSFPLLPIKDFYELSLKSYTNPLPPVTVKNKRSFKNLKPDTSAYNVSDYHQRVDRTIGDVLKRIPGIEVQKNGAISYNGKPISSFYIDGDDLVSNRYSIASNSILHGYVEKIEVIKIHNPIRVLQGATTNNGVAINLTLKENKKVSFGGYADLLAGNDKNYKAEANILMLTKKQKSINGFKLNNIGKDLLQETRVHNLSDFLKTKDIEPLPKLLSGGQTNTPDISNERVIFNNAKFLSFNNSKPIGKNWNVRSNNYLHFDLNSSSNGSLAEIQLPSNIFTYTEEQTKKESLQNYFGQIAITKNIPTTFLKNEFSYTISQTNGGQSNKLNTLFVNQNFLFKTINFSNDLSIIKKTRNGSIIEFSSFNYYNNAPEDVQISPIPSFLLIDTFKNKSLVQFFRNNHFFNKNTLSLRKINANLLQEYKLGFINSNTTFNTFLETIDTTKTRMGVLGFTNDYSWKKIKYFASIQYDILLPQGLLTVSLPINYISLTRSDWQFADKVSLNTVLVTPKIFYKADFSAESSLTTSYEYNISPVLPQDAFKFPVLVNNFQLTSKDISLNLSKYQIGSITFTKRKTAKFLNGSIGLSLINGQMPYINTVDFLLNNQFLKSIDYTNLFNRLNVSFSLSKYYPQTKLNLISRLLYSHSKTQGIQNNKLLSSIDRSYQLENKLQLKISQTLGLSYGLNLGYTRGSIRELSNQSIQEMRQLIQNATINFSPLDNLNISFTTDYYSLKAATNKPRKIFFGDLNANYKLNKQKIEFSFEATNLFNQSTYSFINVNGNSINTSYYNLRPRIILFGTRFYF